MMLSTVIPNFFTEIQIDWLISKIDIDKIISKIQIDTLFATTAVVLALLIPLAIFMMLSTLIPNFFNEIRIDRLISKIDIDKIVSKIQIDALFATTAVVLALLIPLAIFMMENNDNSKDGSLVWDKMVIFTCVLNIKTTSLGLLFITIPLIFWNFQNFKPYAFILFIIGLGCMINLLKNCYKWIIVKRKKDTNYRSLARIKYLDKIKNDEEKYAIWKLIWDSDKNRLDLDEQYLVKKYIEHVNEFTNKSSNKTQLLSIYIPNMKITYKNQSLIEEFMYCEIKTLINSKEKDLEKNKQIKLFKEMYLKYTEQSITDVSLCSQFSEKLNTFIKKESSEETKKFIELLGVNLIEKMRENFSKNENLKDYFPEKLRYEEKSSSGTEGLFEEWLVRTKILDNYEEGEKSIFAEELMQLMFSEISTGSYSRLINFSYYFQKNGIINDEDKSKEQLLNYAKQKHKLAVGGFYIPSEFTTDDKQYRSKLESKRKKEEEWTYSYILKTKIPFYQILNDIAFMKEKHTMVKNILDEKNIDDEYSKTKLESLEKELESFIQFMEKEKNSREET